MKIQDLKCFVFDTHVNALCKRAPIWICKACNYRCKFCYNKNSMQGFTCFEDMKCYIDELLDAGHTEIELTGGEPTIHPDFFKYCEYITERCGHVSCLSNGSKLSNLDFAKRAKECGLNEVMFSVHSSIPEVYDDIVQHKGAFKKLIQGIKNCQSLGMRIRVNCTVNNENYAELPNEFYTLMNSLNPFEVNFILVNYWSDNSTTNFEPCKLKECTQAMKDFATLWNDKSLLNFRYVPMCYVKGFEKYVCDYPQLPFDVYDWSLCAYRHTFEKTKDIKNYTLKMYNALETLKNQGTNFTYQYCENCSHKLLCDGLKQGMNTYETYPYDGEEIHDTIYYRQGFYN